MLEINLLCYVQQNIYLCIINYFKSMNNYTKAIAYALSYLQTLVDDLPKVEQKNIIKGFKTDSLLMQNKLNLSLTRFPILIRVIPISSNIKFDITKNPKVNGQQEQLFLYNLKDDLYQKEQQEREEAAKLNEEYRIKKKKKKAYQEKIAQLEEDLKDCDVEGNDVIILCSDGLYEYINIQDVADKISNCAGNYKSVCEELTQEAIANGSKDNISIVTIPLIGQLRNVLPPGYNVSIDDSKEDSFDDDNYDSGIEEYQIDNNIYVLHLIILVILFNFISIMFFLVGLN